LGICENSKVISLKRWHKIGFGSAAPFTIDLSGLIITEAFLLSSIKIVIEVK
jgi:hypothetical protein